MFCRGFVGGIGITVFWLGQAGLARADDAPRIHSAPAPRPVAEQVAEAVEPEGAPVLMQLLIVELRGDIPRALKEAGFRESAAGSRYVSGMGHRTDRDAENVSALLKTLAAHTEVDILSRPQVRTLMGQSASIQVGALPPRVQYLVRTGAKSFELREAAGVAPLGITIHLTARPGDDPEQVEISPLKISTTTLDGREPIPGLDLDVGKPIVSTRTLETSITLVEGSEVNGIVLPGPPGRQPVLFLSIRRAKATPGEGLPNPVPDVPARSPSGYSAESVRPLRPKR